MPGAPFVYATFGVPGKSLYYLLSNTQFVYTTFGVPEHPITHCVATAPSSSDSDAVVILLRRLGSLLSNVNSSDENLPITLLHTSFHDFLTNKQKSGKFRVNLRDTHRQLAHSSGKWNVTREH